MNNKSNQNVRLPPEVNRIIFVRNLPHKISPDELYDIFGKYGAIRQIRKGVNGRNKGTAYRSHLLKSMAFVIYEDIFEAKNEKLKTQLIISILRKIIYSLIYFDFDDIF